MVWFTVEVLTEKSLDSSVGICSESHEHYEASRRGREGEREV